MGKLPIPPPVEKPEPRLGRIVSILEQSRGNVLQAVNTNGAGVLVDQTGECRGNPERQGVGEVRRTDAPRLSKRNQIFSSKYLANLPIEEQLRTEIRRKLRLREAAMEERRELTEGELS